MRLYAVGVGPGDPELLTLKGRRLITAAEVIFAPSGRGGEGSLALAIVAPYLDHTRQELVLLPFPLTRDTGTLDAVWQEHAATVAKKLRGDRTGVFLVEGDPSLYGSFNHLHAALARQHADVAVEVIPGIPSPVAAAAAAGIPLATRAERIAIVPAASPDTPEVLTSFETVVVLKPSTGIDGLLDALDATGRTADAVWIRHAGMADEEIERDVRRLRGTRPDYFSLIIVRKRTDA